MEEKEWNDFIEDLYLRAMRSFELRKVFEYQMERKKRRKELMENLLAPADRAVFEEISLEIWEDMEYRMRVLYQQGFEDCIQLLKTLKII
mgnify:CR=1 FL=1